MITPNAFNIDQLVNFINDNSISTLIKFGEENEKNIKKISDELVKNIFSSNKSSDLLKLKTWVLLSKNSANQKKIQEFLQKSPLHLSSKLKHELIQNLFFSSELWRLKKVAALGIQLNSFDYRTQFLNEIKKRNPNLEIVRFILDSGVINLKEEIDDKGNTLFHYALKEKPVLGLIQLFVEFGADINHQNKEGDTPLHLATKNPKVSSESLKFLLIAGAKVGIKNQLGQTPLHIAVLAHHPALEGIKAIILAGNNVNELDSKGNAPIHYAMEASTDYNHDLELIELLWMWGANLEVRNFEGETPLHLAVVKSENLHLVEQLLLCGANIQSVDRYGNTPLHSALMRYPVPKDIASLLINNGANCEAMNSLGVTCISLMAFEPKSRQQLEDVIEFLYRKLLANSWNIPNGSFVFRNQVVPFQYGSKDQGEGHTLRLLDIFEKHPTNKPLEGVFDMYRQSVKNGKLNPSEFKEKFDNGESFSICTGFINHVFEMTIFKDSLVICNRGAGMKVSSSVHYKINRKSSRLTEEVIAKIQQGRLPTAEGEKFFYEELPLLLGYDSRVPTDPLTMFYHKEARQKPQKSSNCWWVHPKAGIFEIIRLQAISSIEERSKNSDMDDAGRYLAFKKSTNMAEEIYKRFSEFSRVQILIEYITNLKTEAPREHQLVSKVVEKMVKQKKWKYAFQKNGYFKAEELLQLCNQYQSHYGLNRADRSSEKMESESSGMEIDV